jgi:hypothetical protein
MKSLKELTLNVFNGFICVISLTVNIFNTFMCVILSTLNHFKAFTRLFSLRL